MTQENFVLKYKEFADEAGKRYYINPLVLLAQAAVASEWGANSMAKNQKNFFGIIASGIANDYWDGSVFESKSGFKKKYRKYKTEQDSFMDFAKFIKEKHTLVYSSANQHRAYAQMMALSPLFIDSGFENREEYKNAIIEACEAINTIIENQTNPSDENTDKV